MEPGCSQHQNVRVPPWPLRAGTGPLFGAAPWWRVPRSRSKPGHVGLVDVHTHAEAGIVAVSSVWPEPFGLVMVESMACGTPVVAYRAGSVPEVIDPGLTGFIVESVDQSVEALKKIQSLDRRLCREVFERRFSSGRMAVDYLKIYEKLLTVPR